MLHVLYEVPGNTLLAANTDLGALPSPPANSGVVSLPEWSEVPPAPYRWDVTRLNFTQPEPGTLVSRQTFMDRIGQSGIDAVMWAAWQNDVGGARLRGWLLRFLVVPEVDLVDPRTIAGVDELIAVGLIGADRRSVILAVG